MRPRVRMRRLAAPPRWMFLGILLIVTGCGGSASHRQELESLLETRDWDEIRARVQLLRQEGARGPWIDLSEGLALLHQNADKAAEPLFAAAVGADSTLAVRVAAHYAELAAQDRAEGWNDRARRRLADAVRLDPKTDAGDQLGVVADYFFRFDRDFERAFPLYRRLYRERPEPSSRHPEWVYRYAHCLEVLGFEDNALVVYDEFVDTWPDERGFMRYTQWRRSNLLIQQAERSRAEARPGQALELLQRCIDAGWHVDQQQRARYLAGEIEEDRGDLHAARAWYEEVIEAGGSASGQLIEQAKTRLEALGALGVH